MTIDFETEEWARDLFGRDFSAGTEGFRDELLRRCLDELGRGGDGARELDDGELDMLAAAGGPFDGAGPAWELRR